MAVWLSGRMWLWLCVLGLLARLESPADAFQEQQAQSLSQLLSFLQQHFENQHHHDHRHARSHTLSLPLCFSAVVALVLTTHYLWGGVRVYVSLGDGVCLCDGVVAGCVRCCPVCCCIATTRV